MASIAASVAEFIPCKCTFHEAAPQCVGMEVFIDRTILTDLDAGFSIRIISSGVHFHRASSRHGYNIPGKSIRVGFAGNDWEVMLEFRDHHHIKNHSGPYDPDSIATLVSGSYSKRHSPIVQEEAEPDNEYDRMYKFFRGDATW